MSDLTSFCAFIVFSQATTRTPLRMASEMRLAVVD
jgi:hypothetical protein